MGQPRTIFLLSPARCSTARAGSLIEGRSASAIAQQLGSLQGAPLGEVFAFLSSLYFRGKLAYARTFARTSDDAGVFVITPGEGLRAESERITASRMRAFAECEVHHENAAFAGPLSRDAEALRDRADSDARFVLLGSVASAKYVAPLSRVFGERLLFPSDFVGRGDMSRGGLLLRAAADQIELAYGPVIGAVLRGKRPPKLPPRPRA